MAVDLSSANAYPYTKRITLGTAGTVTEVQIAGRPTLATFQFITNNGKVATTGTDATAVGSEYITVTAGNPIVYTVGKDWRGGSFFLTATVDSTVVEVVLEVE